MSFKLALVASAASLTCLATAVHADSINFGQFGSNYESLPNVLVGATMDGVSITVTGPGSGFQELEEQIGWDGNFPLNTPVLYDNGVPGAVTIDFATPITNITDLALESNEFGAFTATLQAYDGLTYLGSQSFMSTSADDPGSQMSFNFSSAAITSIVLSSTNDGAGLGLGGAGGTGGYSGGVPEPTAWALMLLGVAGLGATLRRRREQGAFA
jgi:hypothetical protein